MTGTKESTENMREQRQWGTQDWEAPKTDEGANERQLERSTRGQE